MFNQTFASNSFTLSPATPKLLGPLNPNRRLLYIGVNGVAPATIKFGSAPASATDGFTLGAASVVGEQGGSILFCNDSETIDSHVPVDAIYAFSNLGTTVTVISGTVANFL